MSLVKHHRRTKHLIIIRNSLVRAAMTKCANVVWKDLKVEPCELRLGHTLNMGQCFNWKRIYEKSDENWVGIVNNLPLVLRQTKSTTEFACLTASTESDMNAAQQYLYEYFQLKYSLHNLYLQWSDSCSRMRSIAEALPGVRVIQQDPWECLISFVCSSCNNIPRITQMLDKLRYHYGGYQCSLAVRNSEPEQSMEVCLETSLLHFIDAGGNVGADSFAGELHSNDADSSAQSSFINGRPVRPGNEASTAPNPDPGASIDTVHHMFSFPSPETLAAASEDDLRTLGMGYRAKYIVQTARLVVARGAESGLAGGGRAWLESLRSAESDVAQSNKAGVHIKSEYGDDSGCARRVVDSNTEMHIPHGAALPSLVKMEPQESLAPSSSSFFYDANAVDTDRETRFSIRQTLLQFPGVGPKVADCIALFSLGSASTIPVDTHVWSIATRDYAPELLQHKSLTPKVYESVGAVFRDRFGSKAGWAHSVLFAAELPEFRKLLPVLLQNEIKVFADSQKASKKIKKEGSEEVAKKKKLKDEDVSSVRDNKMVGVKANKKRKV